MKPATPAITPRLLIEKEGSVGMALASPTPPSPSRGTQVCDPSSVASPLVGNGPELWAMVLGPAREAFGSGVVAGGCVRDYLLGCPPKDIDVFVAVRDREHLVEGAKRLGKAFAVAPMTVEEASEYEAGVWVSDVRGVLDGDFSPYPDARPDEFEKIFTTYRVQIIGHEGEELSGEKLVETFDFGITRCWWDGELHDTPEAKRDRDERTVTLLFAENEERAQRSATRFDRFVRNHTPPFTFVRALDGAAA